MKSFNDYINLCTEEQIQRAYKLGAPIETYESEFRHPFEHYIEDNGVQYNIPTTQQMIGWLEEKIGPNIYCFIANKEERFSDWYCYPSRKDAELAVIDAALDYLEKGYAK